MSAAADQVWADALAYARELLDPWARNEEWNECDARSHELEAEGLEWGAAFVAAAEELGADIDELLDTANWLAERPDRIGVIAADELRGLMGDDAPASL